LDGSLPVGGFIQKNGLPSLRFNREDVVGAVAERVADFFPEKLNQYEVQK
jgi:hypothetical protein